MIHPHKYAISGVKICFCLTKTNKKTNFEHHQRSTRRSIDRKPFKPSRTWLAKCTTPSGVWPGHHIQIHCAAADGDIFSRAVTSAACNSHRGWGRGRQDAEFARSPRTVVDGLLAPRPLPLLLPPSLLLCRVPVLPRGLPPLPLPHALLLFKAATVVVVVIVGPKLLSELCLFVCLPWRAVGTFKWLPLVVLSAAHKWLSGMHTVPANSTNSVSEKETNEKKNVFT